MANGSLEIGIVTLGDYVSDAKTKQKISPQQRLKEIVAAAKLADEAGLDAFGVGEHHSSDFVVSAVPVVLAAIAQATKQIRLTSAVTILSTLDPVHVFEDFATVDLLSEGRAEMIAGRGAFIESFPLFGYDLNDYDELFAEKLDLLLKLNKSERVTWRGKFRAPLDNAEIAPRPMQKELPIWIGVGGTPESAVRAAMLDLPMVVAIIGGAWVRFKPLIELYRKARLEARLDPAQTKLAVTSYLHIAQNSQDAINEFYPYHTHYFAQLGNSRGRNMTLSRRDYEWSASAEGAYFVGSPQQIIDKILHQHEVFGHQRFMGQVDIGGLPFNQVAKTIETLATEVVPVVRRETAKKSEVVSE